MSIIADEIQNQLNKKYGQFNKQQIAQRILKDSVNIGEAIVNVLYNTGIAGFKFNIPEKEQLKFQSDVTDHYTDRNNAIQDHIAQKPITITLTGLHGEYFYSVHQIADTVANIIPTLSLIKQFIPKLPDGAKQNLLKKYQQITNTNDVPEALTTSIPNEVNGINLFAMFQSLYKLTSSQTRAYLFLKALWQSKAIFSVETSFEKFDNMTIIEMTPLRQDSADMAQFSVTFKQMNFAKTITTTAENAVGRLSQMLSSPVNKGLDKGKETAVL